MIRRIGTLLFITLLLIGGPASAQEPSKAAPDLTKDIERLSRDLDNLKQTRQSHRADGRERRKEFHQSVKTLRRDVDRLIDAAEQNEEYTKERLADQDSDITRFLNWAGYFGLLLPLVIAGLGLAAYNYSGNKAKEAAESWFNENGKDTLDTLKDTLDTLKAEAEKEIPKMIEDAKKALVEFNELKDVLNNRKADETAPPLSKEKQESLKEAASDAKDKPESERTYDDWNFLAFEAVRENDQVSASQYFGKAALSSNATLIQSVKAYFNKGITLGKRGKPDEAIRAFDEIISHYGDANEAAIRELVAGAFVNKGVALEKLGKPGEAIQACDETIFRYGDDEEAVIRERVAKAFVYKGLTLGKLGKPDEAIQAYDEVISRYGDAEEAVLREHVAKAYVNKGFTVFTEAKRRWSGGTDGKNVQEELTATLASFEAALTIDPDIMIDPDKAVCLGNRGYTHFLLGDRGEAEADLRRALDLGGKEIRDGALADADIHPVPLDKEFKALVNRLWDEVSAGEA